MVGVPGFHDFPISLAIPATINEARLLVEECSHGWLLLDPAIMDRSHKQTHGWLLLDPAIKDDRKNQ
jgi:hypothetical protein